MTIPQSAIHAQQSPLRLGIFGGSFDPVHRGHLVLADCCLEQAKLDAVWFVPAAQQPFKPDGPRASSAQRLAMLQLVANHRPEFQVASIELDRGGVSYTVETLEAIRNLEPAAELFFLMGADALAELPLWHRATEVCQLATPLIVRRAGAEAPNFHSLQQIATEEQVERTRRCQIKMPATPISSSQIRQLVATSGDFDGDWDKLVLPAVADYIRKHALYK